MLSWKLPALYSQMGTVCQWCTHRHYLCMITEMRQEQSSHVPAPSVQQPLGGRSMTCVCEGAFAAVTCVQYRHCQYH